MSRQLKFRAWFDGHMYEVAKLDFWGNPDQASYELAGAGENGEWEELFDIYIDEVELMQYTGLKDKNGKEIYEGDIVTVIDEILGSPFCDGITGKIVYDEAAFFIVPKNVLETQWLFNECAVYEVIGNIYEDPNYRRGK